MNYKFIYFFCCFICVCVCVYNIFNLCGSFLKIIIFICVCTYTFFVLSYITPFGISFGSLSTFYLQIKSIKSRWCVNTSTNFIFYSLFFFMLCSSTQRLNFPSLVFFCYSAMKNVPDKIIQMNIFTYFFLVEFITEILRRKKNS